MIGHWYCVTSVIFKALAIVKLNILKIFIGYWGYLCELSVRVPSYFSPGNFLSIDLSLFFLRLDKNIGHIEKMNRYFNITII